MDADRVGTDVPKKSGTAEKHITLRLFYQNTGLRVLGEGGFFNFIFKKRRISHRLPQDVLTEKGFFESERLRKVSKTVF